MPSNIEVKMKVRSLDAVESLALAAGATHEGLLVQKDVFYRCANGRLKLRAIAGDHAELIAYARNDQPSIRESSYDIARIPDAEALNEVLARALGVCGVVAKKRTLLLWRNVRIHLDRVEGLGEYIEFESVVGPTPASQARANLDELLGLLKLVDATVVPVAYVDLLAGEAREVVHRSCSSDSL